MTGIVPRRPRFRIQPYIEFAKKAMAREGTYRFDVFTTVGSFVVLLYLLRMVWTALYAHNAAPVDLSRHEIITYSAVALLMGIVMDIDQTRALHDKLHDGSIATDFMKPIIVPLYFFADGTGEVLFHAALLIPSILIALLIFNIIVPPPMVLAAFFVSFLLGYLVGFFLNFILNCTAFWTLEISAAQLIVTWLTDLLGGELIPLSAAVGLLLTGRAKPGVSRGAEIRLSARLTDAEFAVWNADLTGGRLVNSNGGKTAAR